MIRNALIIKLTFLFCLFSFLPLSANTPEGMQGNEEFKEISRELRCPTCTGLSIFESDAPFSNQIKAEVAQQLKQGKDRKEILDFFVDRYGYWILRAPPMEGLGQVAWFVPALLLILGPLFVWVFVWRRKRTTTEYNVRSAEEIMQEMQDQLAKLRTSSPVETGGSK
ncbi:MAG: cytochrome c-type biogenesis protein CcmH [Oligoflexales bacterium]|nr:cytochrome c-type biogenesis protein CcmH [Oligoflexales bacterium]